ncbi:MAG: hypothetical protein WC356_02520 [Candidatus Micrarchaeia archaeon]|jgi:Arc/MetJ-type ribon-helix-helix transcriptional regulator
MNINLHLTGELEQFINSLVSRGLAANKTEAIRQALVNYYETHKNNKSREDKDLINFTMEASEPALKKIWNNPKDDEVWSKY